MKELIHLAYSEEDVKLMGPEIEKFIENNPDASYSQITLQDDPGLFHYYATQYIFPQYPVFLGFVDGRLQDGHIGYGTEMVLSSLIN
jgi:hypothetical protein